MSMLLEDNERRFADSEAGQAALAQLQRQHAVREAHRGPDARPWTDGMAAAAIRQFAAASTRISDTAEALQPCFVADRVAENAARIRDQGERRERLRLGWRDASDLHL